MKRPSIRITFAVVALAAAAVLIGDLARHAAGRKLREAILAELQPVALKNCTLKRFGSANDGGYLMCENLVEPLDSGYSYGVGSNDDWGCDVSRRYHVPVHQYDCFDPARPTCDGGTFLFHNECVGDRTGYRESRFFDTLENQIRKNGHIGRRLIIKMDIEGAEWDALPEGSAASCLGVPGALGEQADRRARSDRTDPCTDEPAKCARFTNVARLSVEHTAIAALKRRWYALSSTRRQEQH